MPHPQWNIPSYNPSPSAYTVPLQSQYTPPPHHHSHYPSPYYTPYPPPLTHTMPRPQWNIPSYNPSPSADTVPPQSQYTPPPAPAQGRKKAVICGISYKHSKNPIRGSINDAKDMKQLLIDKFQFSKSSIVMLTEEETNPKRRPTKYNMLRKLEWLVQDCKPGDSLLFYYSGHGSQMEYFNSDEVDGQDEALCPLDYETQGRIVDDDINKIIVRPLPHGVKLHAIIDACHSATVLDLPFLYRKNMSTGHYLCEDHHPRSGEWKGSDGEVICFSGCDDHQKSFDDQLPSKNTHSGVMTSCFIKAIQSGHATTYGNILDSLRHSIATVGCSNGWPTRQEPQLTASQLFDVYAKPFSL
ncbi:hypothetical protein F0562_018574 [Nyssa sinensis]|uniref:Peptidase C14 caspase domain-containing protein n=1 Tax=Nyssa sinensis TaxID=561372 RepID=A0A5J4ZB53_9ASTE|nr:hypothetical protein F0562_018574 [Nyssa sinensis]